jgi:hypothetical protein
MTRNAGASKFRTSDATSAAALPSVATWASTPARSRGIETASLRACPIRLALPGQRSGSRASIRAATTSGGATRSTTMLRSAPTASTTERNSSVVSVVAATRNSRLPASRCCAITVASWGSHCSAESHGEPHASCSDSSAENSTWSISSNVVKASRTADFPAPGGPVKISASVTTGDHRTHPCLQPGVTRRTAPSCTARRYGWRPTGP